MTAGRRRMRTGWLMGALGALMLLASPIRAAEPENAATFLRHLGDRAIENFADEELSLAEREARFRRMLEDNFAMRRLSRFILGRYWRVASEDKRLEFQETLQKVLAQRFLPMFQEYTHDDFQVKSAQRDPDTVGAYIVTTRIQEPSNDRMITANWRVRERDDRVTGFQIFDVRAEGVSMAITLRSEYNSVIERNGGSVAALVDQMKKRLGETPAE